jgi:hypothetical protein
MFKFIKNLFKIKREPKLIKTKHNKCKNTECDKLAAVNFEHCYECLYLKRQIEKMNYIVWNK